MLIGILLSCVVGYTLAQSDSSPAAETTPEVEQSDYLTRTYEHGPFEFDYVLDYYSMRFGGDYAPLETGRLVTNTGVIQIVPNDNVIYKSNVPPLPLISISAIEVDADTFLDESMLGDGAIIQYVDMLIQPDSVTQITIDDVAALRVDDLPVGQRASITHVVILKDEIRYDITFEPYSGVGTTDLYDEQIEFFLENFRL